MGKFVTSLKAEQIDENYWILTEPLVYRSDKLGFIIADQGTKTNFASVPRLPVFWLFAGGKNNPPAALHDRGYEEKKFTRLQYDNMFFQAIIDWIDKIYGSVFMRVIAYPLAAVSWLFVRVFGWNYWK